MASIVLPPLLQVILEKIADPVLQKLTGYLGLQDQFKKLQSLLPMVQTHIQDAEEQQFSDIAVRIWLCQLKHAAEKVKDLLEDIKYMHKTEMFYSTNISNLKILDDLTKAATKGFHLQLAERNIGENQFEKKETTSFFTGSEIYGREEDKGRIIDMFLTTSIVDEGTASVISIVGTPGIGKTTLAQFIYNDGKVMEHFHDLRIWVFVSRYFNARRTIKAVIESSTGNKCDPMSLDILYNELWKSLEKKKYLLVLDDVWIEDQDDWDVLRPLLKCGLDGSKILVTTRSQKVAMTLGNSNSTYSLKGLSNDDCWKIFKERASFTRTKEVKYPNLQVIGKQLMGKCEGIPLAAKILGGHMRSKTEEREWLYVHNSNLWKLKAYRNKILPALLVSYMHMPLYLKHCFVFCSVFPKNYEIKREKLIHMWMAIGLILPNGGSKALEDIGDEYFNELLCMSVFEEVKEHEGGAIGGYKINEYFHSLAQSLTENEYVVVENELEGNTLEQVHHASVVSKYGSFPTLAAFRQVENLRTLLVFSESGALENCSHICKLFPCLRILDLSGCQVQLPSINCLVRLRYLDLSYNHFSMLPAEISSLHCLETFNLFGCYNLQLLPDLSHITGLRHLNIGGCEALMEMPTGIGSLLHLQTLPIFIVHTQLDHGENKDLALETLNLGGEQGRISDLKHLKLRGDLKIKHLERAKPVKEEMPLMNKEYLESLGLCWGNDAGLIMNPTFVANITRFQERKHNPLGPSEDPETLASHSDQELAGEVLECLQPHKNSKKMFVVGYPGIRFPHWTLPNLTEMVLINIEGWFLPMLGHLPLLRTLRMEGMHNIEFIGGYQFYGEDVPFRSLQELYMIDFPRLGKWIGMDGLDDVESFPLLSKLVIRNCPNIKSLPVAFTHLEKLQYLSIQDCPELQRRYQREGGEDWWKVSHVPQKRIFSSQQQ